MRPASGGCSAARRPRPPTGCAQRPRGPHAPFSLRAKVWVGSLASIFLLGDGGRCPTPERRLRQPRGRCFSSCFPCTGPHPGGGEAHDLVPRLWEYWHLGAPTGRQLAAAQPVCNLEELADDRDHAEPCWPGVQTRGDLDDGLGQHLVDRSDDLGEEELVWQLRVEHLARDQLG